MGLGNSFLGNTTISDIITTRSFHMQIYIDLIASNIITSFNTTTTIATISRRSSLQAFTTHCLNLGFSHYLHLGFAFTNVSSPRLGIHFTRVTDGSRIHFHEHHTIFLWFPIERCNTHSFSYLDSLSPSCRPEIHIHQHHAMDLGFAFTSVSHKIPHLDLGFVFTSIQHQ